MFTDTLKVNDKVSVVNNQHIPQRTRAEVVSIDREAETVRVKYTQDNIEKFRNVELSQICPSSAHFAEEMAKCFEMLINR